MKQNSEPSEDGMDMEEEEREERGSASEPRSFEDLGKTGGTFLSAKNYRENEKVKAKLVEFLKVENGKYGYQAIYSALVDSKKDDGAELQLGIGPAIARQLHEDYNVKDFKDAVGKTLTLQVVRTTSSFKFILVGVA